VKASFIRSSSARADNRRMNLQTSPRRSTLRRAMALRALATAFALGIAAGASPEAWARRPGDHDRARAAVQSGEVLPLSTVLQRLRHTHPGQLLEAELEDDKHGGWIYEIKLLQADGHLLKLELDARTAQLLKVKRKDAPKDDLRSGTRKDHQR
jgi:uncharacterized membrane protein YkoI